MLKLRLSTSVLDLSKRLLAYSISVGYTLYSSASSLEDGSEIALVTFSQALGIMKSSIGLMAAT